MSATLGTYCSRTFGPLTDFKTTIVIGLLLSLTTCAAVQSRRQASRHDRADLRPTFKPTLQNVTVNPGERAVLKCRVDNLGTRTVTWRRQTESHPLTIGLFTFAPDPRLTVDYNQRVNEWSLVMQDTKPRDEGVYICQVSTKEDQDNMYIVNLHVRTVQVSGTQFVEAGSTIRLQCNATGKPEPPHNVEWSHDDNNIRSDTRSGVVITKKIETRMLVSLLVIQNSRTSHAGDYACQSSNGDYDIITVHVTAAGSTVDKRGISAEKITGTAAHNSAERLRNVHTILYYILLHLVILYAVLDLPAPSECRSSARTQRRSTGAVWRMKTKPNGSSSWRMVQKQTVHQYCKLDKTNMYVNRTVSDEI